MSQRHGKLVLLFVLMVDVFALLAPSALLAAAHPCNGMGRRFCRKAHTFDKECPMPCKPKNCRLNSPTAVSSNRGMLSQGSEERMPTWEDIAVSGKYDYVYTDDDWLCMATCWLQPWKAACSDSEIWLNKTYCKQLDCAHDKASQKRFSGCHSDRDGNRKRPWHKPTCVECARIFPSACGVDIANHIKAEKLAKEAEQRRLKQARALEVIGRQYCRSELLSGIGEDFSDSSSTFISGSSDGSRSSKSSSGSTSSSSSSSSSEDLEFILADGSKPDTLRLMRTMEAVGRIQCPPIQCFTERDDIVQQYHAKSETWYQTTDDGFCVINGGDCKDGGPATTKNNGSWCGKSLANCRMCWGTWCPPPSHHNHWMPVEKPSFANGPSSRFQYGLTAKRGDDKEQSDFTASSYDRSMCSSVSVTRKSRSDANTLGTFVDAETEFLRHINDVAINSETYAAAGPDEPFSLAESIDQIDVENDAAWVQEQIKYSTSSERINTAVQVAFQLVEEDTIVYSWLRTAISALSGCPPTNIALINISSTGGSSIGSERQATVTVAIIPPDGRLQDLAARLEKHSEDSLYEILRQVANVTYLLCSYSAQIVSMPISDSNLQGIGTSNASSYVDDTEDASWPLMEHEESEGSASHAVPRVVITALLILLVPLLHADE